VRLAAILSTELTYVTPHPRVSWFGLGGRVGPRRRFDYRPLHPSSAA
jgi:hypothetical protein